MDKISVTINDESRQVAATSTVAQILSELKLQQAGIAIAINGTVVPKNEWNNKAIASNDSILIITATQGG